MNGSDNTGLNVIEISAIATIETPWNHPASLPRQSGQTDNFAFVRWNKHLNEIPIFKTHKIRILFLFHKNEFWKPLVQPPRGSSEIKKGVFATRAPYRPNQLGLSTVELVGINKSGIWIKNHDFLNETPVLEIYEFDSNPDASDGWIRDLSTLQLEFSNLADDQLEFLESHGELELRSAIQIWLSNDPFNSKEKRVEKISPSEGIFSFKTWRVEFQLMENKVIIKHVKSGYTATELIDLNDLHKDKKLHSIFNCRFF